jgi:hypothetical protein
MADHGGNASINVNTGKSGGALRYIPYFLLVFVLYLLGIAIKDPRIPFISIGAYQLSWVEILLIVATVLSLAEQMKVSHPGIDNTTEALTMVFMGIAQLVLFVLGVAGVVGFHIFNDFSFLVQTVLSLSASVVAVMINARTLRRTMALGGDS